MELGPCPGSLVRLAPHGAHPSPGTTGLPRWMPDSSCSQCSACHAPFTLLRRRHHCRNCGKVGAWTGPAPSREGRGARSAVQVGGGPGRAVLGSQALLTPASLGRSSAPAAPRTRRRSRTMDSRSRCASAPTATPRTCRPPPNPATPSHVPPPRESGCPTAGSLTLLGHRRLWVPQTFCSSVGFWPPGSGPRSPLKTQGGSSCARGSPGPCGAARA